MAMDTDGGAAVAPGALFAPGPAAAAERGSGLEVPPMVSRRVLDLATYLARHQGAVGRELVLLRVPTAAQQARALAATQARFPLVILSHPGMHICGGQGSAGPGHVPGAAQGADPDASLPAARAAGVCAGRGTGCCEPSM